MEMVTKTKLLSVLLKIVMALTSPGGLSRPVRKVTGESLVRSVKRIDQLDRTRLTPTSLLLTAPCINLRQIVTLRAELAFILIDIC